MSRSSRPAVSKSAVYPTEFARPSTSNTLPTSRPAFENVITSSAKEMLPQSTAQRIRYGTGLCGSSRCNTSARLGQLRIRIFARVCGVG